MKTIDFVNSNLIFDKTDNPSGKVCYKSPSNIALIKYWGKQNIQIPKNPSLSFTLKYSFTETCIQYKANNGLNLEYYFEGTRNKEFGLKVRRYLQKLTEYFPFIDQLSFKMESRNTFPHSSGIASSASAMSAIALGLCFIENQHFNTLNDQDDFYRKASFIARFGSGSASRSVYGNYVLWGKTKLFSDSSDDYAIPLNISDPKDFHDLGDAILIVDKGKKEVSSRAGHELMNNHPFAESRFDQAGKNIEEIITAIRKNNWQQFSEIVEKEALSLHAMMFTSDPSFILLKPNTLKIIEKIRSAREQKGLPVCFTIDAGPNVHLIYQKKYEKKIKAFIKNELLMYCEKDYWIDDQMGNGPEDIKLEKNEN